MNFTIKQTYIILFIIFAFFTACDSVLNSKSGSNCMLPAFEELNIFHSSLAPDKVSTLSGSVLYSKVDNMTRRLDFINLTNCPLEFRKEYDNYLTQCKQLKVELLNFNDNKKLNNNILSRISPIIIRMDTYHNNMVRILKSS